MTPVITQIIIFYKEGGEKLQTTVVDKPYKSGKPVIGDKDKDKDKYKLEISVGKAIIFLFKSSIKQPITGLDKERLKTFFTYDKPSPYTKLYSDILTEIDKFVITNTLTDIIDLTRMIIDKLTNFYKNCRDVHKHKPRTT